MRADIEHLRADTLSEPEKIEKIVAGRFSKALELLKRDAGDFLDTLDAIGDSGDR